MPTKNKRRAAFRKRLTSDPPPPDAETRAKLDRLDQGAAESDAALLRRAREKCGKVDTYVLRGIVAGWLNVDELIVANPAGIARQVLQALDALAIVHGDEKEAAALDEVMRKVHGP